MENKKRWPLHAVWFGCILAVILWYFTGLFWNRTGTSMPFYAEPENSIDVLYFGSSKANAAVAPVWMYEQYGFTGYVMYSWSQPIWTSYYYLEDALKTQSPQVVVIESNDLLYARRSEEYTEQMNAVNNQNALLIPGWDTRLKLMLAMRRCQTDAPSVFSGLSIGRYHTNWKNLTVDDWLWPLWQPERSSGKGYGPLYWVESFSEPSAAAVQPNSDIYPYCLEYLQKIIDLSEKEGFALVVVTYPDAQLTEEDRGRLLYLNQYCEEQEIPVLDFTQPKDCAAAGLSYTAHMGDYSHLNYMGAEVLSAYLGGWLDERYALPNHRGDTAYAAWDNALIVEKRDRQTMQIRLCDQLSDLLGSSRDEEYVTLLYAWGDMTAADAAQLRQLFVEYGLPEEIFDQTAAAQLWVWQNGRFTACADYELAAEHLVQAVPGSVQIDGEEVSYCREGLDVVVVSARTGELLHRITWATEHGYTSYTS